MARSVRSLALYRNEEDYEIFYMILRRTREKYPFMIHSYCLMTTHFHMLVTTMKDEIWKIMKYLMQNYAMYFNRKYGTKGHVFDSRYVSCIIEDGIYFLEVSRYIHLNPVRACMVRNPLDYEFISSGARNFIIIIGKTRNDFKIKREVEKFPTSQSYSFSL